ncbi:MAG TPA: cytochrome C oxidase subunit IV family protein [Candidatus Saccharimonadales bacterium]
MNESYSRAVSRYIIGFVGSAAFTVLAYLAIKGDWLENPAGLGGLLMVFAVLQLIVQIFTFLHLGAEKKPYWKSIGFSFSVIMLVIVVVASIWIMKNLDYNMNMPADAMNDYMIEQNKKGF